jgi:hypothetical protein
LNPLGTFIFHINLLRFYPCVHNFPPSHNKLGLYFLLLISDKFFIWRVYPTSHFSACLNLHFIKKTVYSQDIWLLAITFKFTVTWCSVKENIWT